MFKEISFIKAYKYLDSYWRNNKSHDLSSLLGDMSPNWYFDDLELQDVCVLDDWYKIVEGKKITAEFFYQALITFIEMEEKEFKYKFDNLIFDVTNNKQRIVDFWEAELKPGGETQKAMSYMVLVKYMKIFYQDKLENDHFWDLFEPLCPHWQFDLETLNDKSILKNWYAILHDKKIDAEVFYTSMIEFLERNNKRFDFQLFINHVINNKPEVIAYFEKTFNE
ncbi:MAG TPA: hypothetical protein PLP19_16600 [bacterium]|nr:hypothetical protein [bacterium]HPN45114.1 hypothetical protein [bacterium]